MSSQAEVFYDRSCAGYNGRTTLFWNANKAMGLNADATNASEAVRDIVGQEFEVLGTNAASTDCTQDSTGGIKVATHGGANDSSILLPHLTAGLSNWTGTAWNTAKSPTFDVIAKSGSVITLAKYWMGFKLTNTPTIATDADQVMFTYSTAVGAGVWQYNWSVGGTANVITVPSSIVGAALKASTVFRLRIEVYSDRTHMGFLNDVAIAPAPLGALTSLTTFIPYLGVISLADAVVKSFTVKRYECSQLY